MKKSIQEIIEKDKNDLFNKILSNADHIEIIDAIDNFTKRVIDECFYFAQVDQTGNDFISKELPLIVNRYLKDRKKEMLEEFNQINNK